MKLVERFLKAAGFAALLLGSTVVILSVFWWHYVRPLEVGSQNDEMIAVIGEIAASRGGRSRTVSIRIDWFNPYTWSGMVTAFDGAFPSDEVQPDLFVYLRWRKDQGIGLAGFYTSYVQPDCELGNWREVTERAWPEVREEFGTFDWAGRPLPEAISDLPPFQARYILANLEAVEMFPHEVSLVCAQLSIP